MNGNRGEILISGAGPTGLSAAIFLHEKKVKPRIIEKLKERVPYSKAFGVNSNTLTLFESSGITERFLSNGRKMYCVNFWKNGKILVRNDFTKVKHKYPFMLIQSQSETETILEEELKKRNILVERQTELESLTLKDQSILVTIINKEGHREQSAPEILFAAEGAHSQARKQLGIEFRGHRYEKEWELYDIELDTQLAKDEGHIIAKDEGGLLLIRIRDSVWRLAGNIPNLIEHLPKGTSPGKIKWQSKFLISHRIANHLQKGNVFLGGDTAHVHSPLGARGMNLGIEDAYVFAELYDKNRMKEYEALRRPLIRSVVARVNLITQIAAGDSAFSKWIRRILPFLSIGAPIILPFARKFILGIR
ncbi:hypothetical protein CH373_08430 [Leptospira perolatii]|uniref:FAD-binding domain-containing protein n=1 Tax=Leptospira perolatii TaxID=2023191 RepID=A0A2M9ZNB4_9LEPT|nr:FAD-dependent monooxygenase [Leptospira perolatii]PJZ68688.1 hypothetical protein CH360_14925 [Leptospira perolatii]PJZ73524.1 hypothetical protein CH373_08430 [Leptospira perolatii]